MGIAENQYLHGLQLLFQQFFHLPQGFASVADGVLFLGRKFCHVFFQFRHIENGVITETIFAGGFPADNAFYGIQTYQTSAVRESRNNAADVYKRQLLPWSYGEAGKN